MKEYSRIRFNPVTKEIEVEGSEAFVKTYFAKLQLMLAGNPGNAGAAKAPRTGPAREGRDTKARRSKGTAKGNPPPKTTQTDRVIGIIRESAAGFSTAELAEKTGLSRGHIRNILNRANRDGRIKTLRRGLYGPA